MRRILKWLGVVFAGLLSLVLLAFILAYVITGRALKKRYEVPAATIILPTDSQAILEGRRLATIRGCYGGCHGEGAEGGVFFDEPIFGRAVAPDLTRVVREYSLAEIDHAVRHGVRRNGRSVFAMPSTMYYDLSDRDFGAIIAFLQTVEPSDGPEADFRLGPLGRLFIATFLVLGERLPAEEIDHNAPRIAADPTDPIGYGRYLARTSCTECHGMDLLGSNDGSTPSLTIAAAYSPDHFARLLRTGVPRDGRELDLMAVVARGRFVYFTDSEIEALHAYLKQLASEGATED